MKSAVINWNFRNVGFEKRDQSSDFTFCFNFVTLVKNIRFKLFTLKTNGLDD